MSVTDPHIISEKRGHLGLLTLARPQALNALTHGMVKAIAASLSEWAMDDGIRAVAIRGEGRAFCAGGDIRAVQQAVMAGSDEGAALLRDEYHMNALIDAYPKPYVALIHGICMGGGAGVSVHGSHRLADASLGFAMPETAIGFVPDIGSSHFLSRAPAEMGMYLGLTAERIGLGDALEAGFVTHAVNAADFDAVIEGLTKGESVDEAIAPFVRKAGPGTLAPHRRQIQTIFAGSSVEAILERLDRDGSEFARTTAQIIRARSPTSLKIVFRQLRAAAKLNLKECLEMELRLALRLLPGHDFREGVRAALIDKDRAPKWQPSALAGVGDIGPFFAPLSNGDLF
ncbi:MAG: enoyl-CoA hydratase/isomerase family protein [Alphaproteobacteria bacterium]|nr:enoyl-CoA hydratase/isomerase family protein [Alphaproteobacteria bacterium]